MSPIDNTQQLQKGYIEEKRKKTDTAEFIEEINDFFL